MILARAHKTKTMSEFYHGDCPKKPHKTYNRPRFARGRRQNEVPILDLLCLKHNVAFCRCGWEWGKHYADNPSIQITRGRKMTQDIRMTRRELQYASDDEIEEELSTF